MMVTYLFKIGRKIRGYIRQDGDVYSFCTGKPSDGSCFSWKYDTKEEAMATGMEYMDNYLSSTGGKYTIVPNGAFSGHGN